MTGEMRVVCIGSANREFIFSMRDIQVIGNNPFPDLEGKFELISITPNPQGDHVEYALHIKKEDENIIPVRFSAPSGTWDQPAGSALNIAMGARRLGMQHVTLVTPLAAGPHDHLSDGIRTYVIDAGVTLLHFERPTTPVTIIIVDSDGEQKKSIVLFYKPYYEIPQSRIAEMVKMIVAAGPTHVFATGIRLSELSLVQRVFREIKRNQGEAVTCCFIPNSSILSPQHSSIRHKLKSVAPYVDVWQMNQREAELYLDRKLTPDGVRHIAERLKVKTCIVTRDSSGAWAVINGKPYNVPAAEVPKVIDTTGAGDAFLLGLAVGRYEGHQEVSQLQVASLFGASNTMALGGHGGMPTKEKCENWLSSSTH